MDTDITKMLKTDAQNIWFRSVWELKDPGDRHLFVKYPNFCYNFNYRYGNISPNILGINMLLALFLSSLTWQKLRDEELTEWFQATWGLITDILDLKVWLLQEGRDGTKIGGFQSWLQVCTPSNRKLCCIKAQSSASLRHALTLGQPLWNSPVMGLGMEQTNTVC